MLRKLTAKNGFTIVELIVIVAVIGILGTIAIVSYGGARQNAARSAAETTAQQVKLKIGEYYTDNNFYPLTASVIDTYLRGSNAAGLADDFDELVDNGATYTPTASCNNTSILCATYTISIPASAWGGSGAALTVTP